MCVCGASFRHTAAGIDYCCPSFKAPDGGDFGSAAALAILHHAVGLLLEPDKHQPPASNNIFLGVHTDVSNLGPPHPYVEFRPSEERKRSVLQMLDEGATSGLKPHTASVILGKLGWILQAAWGGVGRAAIQPLVSRAGTLPVRLPGNQTAPPETTRWTPQLAHMTRFIRALFDRLPPLRWYVGVPRKSKVVVYVDAQYSHDGRKGVGIVIVDTHDNTRRITGGTIPTYLLSWLDSFATNSQQRINQCELLSVVVAVISFPELFQDRDVLLWSDSTAALKACIDRYSRAPEMAALGSGLHLLLADLQARVLYQHVPGKANPADIPSRSPFIFEAGAWKPDPTSLSLKDKTTLAGINATFFPVRFPSQEQLLQDDLLIMFDHHHVPQ